MTGLLFPNALVVEAHQAGKKFGVGEVGGPAVGGYGVVELLVQAQDDGSQALLINGLLLGRGEGLAGAQLFHHVVEVGEDRVLGLLALAVGVELFGQLPDARLLLRRGRREGKRIKTTGFVGHLHLMWSK